MCAWRCYWQCIAALKAGQQVCDSHKLLVVVCVMLAGAQHLAQQRVARVKTLELA